MHAGRRAFSLDTSARVESFPNTMPKPTRTTIAVAIAFVAVVAFGAIIAALAASMYAELVALPHDAMVVTNIFTTGFAALGLVHIVWTRGDPSHSTCLFFLFANVACCSVLLGYAVSAIPLTMRAIEAAPALTTYQHRMEAFFASGTSRQFNYSDSLSGYRSKVPSHPLSYSDSRQYPFKAARAFADAYCASEGHRFCSAFPLTQTILYPGMWPDPNATAEIARTLSTLPTTLFNVTVTATTTLDSFCAAVDPMNPVYNVSINDSVAIQRAAAIKRDLYDLCRGCATLSNITTKSNALQSWIHATCPMDVPKPTGAYCVATADCAEYKIKTGGNICPSFSIPIYERTYLNPSYDACFGRTLMTVAHHYELAIAITAGALVFILLLLCARLWVLRRNEKFRNAMREAVVQTPVNTA
ncbi:hypothetical protein SDRG_05721 [Saprolegnia diclina VS20]|uniref:Uncharacterized protein n=1 Tax=Saprolegnia diclina (strain VS20) TaxID=1156394 RepID=T0S241_SAPDV|nr:hypothetical protein SDRG_05721 [Saprolegnia diclina VS20]EQC36892.1 hypothetical protein SDRG_05721 [Saprolegnia diclina VS20]|eukprot:XP_008609673.1 hypothetical protein SDRG_05721 [Saprolegnia diclina VS20]